jgi:superfamily II DNA or RNA helicase
MRAGFFHLAYFHTRTGAILRSALDGRREALTQAALRNLIVLHLTLRAMHRTAPAVVPSPVTHLREARLRLVDDLIVQLLQESPAPMSVDDLARCIDETGLLAGTSAPLVRLHLDDLIASGHVVPAGNGFVRSRLPYRADNFDELELHTLLSERLARQLARAGFHSLLDVTARRAEFRAAFRAVTGFGEATASLFVSAASMFEDRELAAAISPWRHADLLHSPHPRPYQLEAYAAFRGHGYQGQVIEAPAGSGKTLIGMLCIQDWLRSLVLGETILVLVPTVNYEQQWLAELCLKPTGLRLSPSLVYTGTPAGLAGARARTGAAPVVLVMTYIALSQAGSAVGKGGFDQDSIEMVLQDNNVQYVILDEVHKVVEGAHGAPADMTRVLVDWLKDGSLRGLIGFSGTAVAYSMRLQQLGLEIAHVVPAPELIAHGFIAPFAEAGVPYAYSDRERRILDLLDRYKSGLRSFVGLIGAATLRRWFAAIPPAERLTIARDILGMYAGRPDRDAAILRRLATWERGADLTLLELPLVSIVQVATGWSDEQMVQESVAASPSSDAIDARARFGTLLDRMNGLRAELGAELRHPDLKLRVAAEGFGARFDAASLRERPDEGGSAHARAGRVKDRLATTLVGLYIGLRDWYTRVGEGRVDSIKAVIAAERAAQPVHGIIIFDTGQPLRHRQAAVSPGYRGAAAVFTELLGDPRATPIAVLSSELYIPHDEHDPLVMRIAGYIRRTIMAGEQAAVLFALVTDGLALSDAESRALRNALEENLHRYVGQLGDIRSARPAEFSRRVLTPLRRAVRPIVRGPARAALRARLTRRNHHMQAWVETFFAYAQIAASFERAPVIEVARVDDARHAVAVLSMPAGRRKQLVYDLTARIVDSEELPVNVVVVSSWARTGWNVITPNVLIDATATRDATAWQQLRGRAMRPAASWTADCHRLMTLLLEPRTPVPPVSLGHEPPSEGTPAARALSEMIGTAGQLDETAKALLRDVARNAAAMDADEALQASIERGDLSHLSTATRLRLATALMMQRNKVTHIYELVRAYGSASQVRWDRRMHRWLRAEPIAAKHRHETAVSVPGGRLVQGPGHAPLVYAGDPRRDAPPELQSQLLGFLRDLDRTIVSGWVAPMP